MSRIYEHRGAIVACCCASVIVCFFLPWIEVHLQPAATFGGLLGGGRPAAVLTVSGADVPRIANGPSARNLVQILGAFCGSVTQADQRRYYVWAVPLLAVLILAASLKFKGAWGASLILGALCAAIVLGAAWRLHVANLENFAVRVRICWASRVIWCAFAVLGWVHFLSIPRERKRPPQGAEPLPEVPPA